MKKNRSDKINELTELMQKALQNSDSIIGSEKIRMKKLVSDPMLLVDAFQQLDPDFSVPSFSFGADTRSLEEIIADNYVALAKFAIEKLQIKNVQQLKVNESDCGFIIYALTPTPIEIDIWQFATSDYPNNKELLLEAEALQADLFMEDSTEKWRLEIIERIESAVL